ncbi:MAG: hypothetical protein K5660_08160 [Paludibacteraceae bacterium]|nr:hypothetical protein [Paludibacteraceae bacterium]
MKRNYFLALVMLLSLTMLIACSKKKDNTVTNYSVNGQSVEQIDLSTLDNTTEACWMITYTDGQRSESTYAWGTERMIVGILKEAYAKATEKEKEEMTKINVTYKKNDVKDAESCWALNPDNDNNGGDNGGNNNGGDNNGGKDDDEIDLNTLDNTTPKCWEVTVNYGVNTLTQYLWMTERELVETMQMTLKNNPYVTYTYKQAAANDVNSCTKLGGNNEGDNDDEDVDDDNTPKFCWHITYAYNGIDMQEYMWDTEEDIKIYAETFGVAGFTNVKYEKSDAKTEDECDALR